MQMIIQNGKVFFPQPDHPIRHVLPGYGKAISNELLLQTVKRDCIYILSVHDGCRKRSGNRTSMEQALWMFGLYHVSIRFTRIDADMMLIHFKLFLTRA